MSASPAPARPEAPAYGPADLQQDLNLSAEVMADLERYRGMLDQANQVMNLVGPSAMADFWRRHALDCAQLLELAPSARAWADLGTGAGLPGLVLAIRLKTTPGAKVVLVESLAKRCRFLAEVVGALALPAEVVQARAEAGAQRVDVVTARACAPMERLLGYAAPWLRHGAIGLFLKGENAEAELQAARESWTFDADLLPSLSDPKGRLVRLRSLARAR